MKTMLMLVVLLLGWGAGPAGSAESGGKRPGGAIVGEKKALSYLKAREPEVYRRLSAMPSARLRSFYGRYFYWFNSPEGQDEHEKAEMARQIKDQLRIDELSAKLRAAGSQEEKDRLNAALKEAATDSFESDLAVLESQGEGLAKKSEELAKAVESLKRVLTQRRADKDRIIAQRLYELQLGADTEQGGAEGCCSRDLDYYNLAAARAGDGDCFGGLQRFGWFLEQQTNHPYSWYSRALLREALGDKAGGEADRSRAQAVAERGPDHKKEAFGAKGGIRCKDAPQGGKSRYFDCRDHDSCMSAARNFIKIDDCSAAAQAYGKAAGFAPKDPWAWYYGSVVRRELGDKAGSDADYARAVALEPGDAGFRDRAKPKDGGRPSFAFVYGARQVCIDVPAAQKQWRIKCEDFDSCYNQVDDLLQKEGDCSGAEEALTRALGYDKWVPWAYDTRSSIRLKLGDREGAAEDYARAMAFGKQDLEFQKSVRPFGESSKSAVGCKR